MSNVKSVDLVFEIDFDLGASSAMLHDNEFARSHATADVRSLEAMLFSMTSRPGIGLALSWFPASPRENKDTGGSCARYVGMIRGSEAFSHSAFDLLRETLLAIPHTRVDSWEVVDIGA